MGGGLGHVGEGRPGTGAPARGRARSCAASCSERGSGFGSAVGSGAERLVGDAAFGRRADGVSDVPVSRALSSSSSSNYSATPTSASPPPSTPTSDSAFNERPSTPSAPPRDSPANDEPARTTAATRRCAEPSSGDVAVNYCRQTAPKIRSSPLRKNGEGCFLVHSLVVCPCFRPTRRGNSDPGSAIDQEARTAHH